MTPDALFAAMDQTWPPATRQIIGPWCIREGRGGGKRVSAATAETAWNEADIDRAEHAMQQLGQDSLFLIRPTDGALDEALDRRGYRIIDPVVGYAAPCAALADPPALPMAVFPHWPPLAICSDIWAEGGIGASRLAVMIRAEGPKCALLSRGNDHPTGAAFVAVHGKAAMLHALEVRSSARRQGSAHNMLRAAAVWAQQNGADTLCLVVTTANLAARSLYASLSMKVVGQYHYRQR